MHGWKGRLPVLRPGAQPDTRSFPLTTICLIVFIPPEPNPQVFERIQAARSAGSEESSRRSRCFHSTSHEATRPHIPPLVS